MNKIKEKIYSISCMIIMIDQLIKCIVQTKLKLGQEIIVIPNFFSINYVKNTGAAFSILNNQTIILTIISILVIIIIDRYITKNNLKAQQEQILTGVLLGGIIGNLLDRIIHKGVIDYLSFQIFKCNFPIFNFADIAITTSITLLVIFIIKEDIRSKKLTKH